MLNKDRSPTISFSDEKDPDWFEKNGGDYGYGNNPESRYDNDGYDRKGYDEYGIDRAGVHEDQYDEKLYNEVLQDFKDIYIPSLSKIKNSSEFRYLEEEEKNLLTEKEHLEAQLKQINKDLERVAKAKSELGLANVIENNIITPKRGFGR